MVLFGGRVDAWTHGRVEAALSRGDVLLLLLLQRLLKATMAARRLCNESASHTDNTAATFKSDNDGGAAVSHNMVQTNISIGGEFKLRWSVLFSVFDSD